MDNIIEFIEVSIISLSIGGIIFWLALMADDSEIVAAEKEIADKMASLDKSLPEQFSLGGLVFTYDGLQGTQALPMFSFKKVSDVKLLWNDIYRIEYCLMDESSTLLHVILAQPETKKKKVIYSYAELTDLKIVIDKYSSKLSGKPIPLIQYNTFLNPTIFN